MIMKCFSWNFDFDYNYKYRCSLLSNCNTSCLSYMTNKDWLELKYYFFCPKLYDVLNISNILRNVINIVWERDIMSCFTKLSLINDMRKINEGIEIRESNK